jgi:hypothetical protein
MVLCVTIVACSYDVMWTGVDFDKSGETLRVAATEPLCGCLQVTNTSSAPLRIRSIMGTHFLGVLDLPPGQSTSAHYDWAGAQGTDTYILEMWDEHGKQLKARDVIRIDDTGWPYQPCIGHLPGREPPRVCAIGALKLTTGRSEM